MSITGRCALLVIFLCAFGILAPQHGSRQHLRKRVAVDANWSGLISSMEKMHRALTGVETAGDADVDFVQLMLPHGFVA